MELTPLDVRNQNFSKKNFGGCDPEEVKAFLNQVANFLEELLVERADLLKTINGDKKSVEKYRENEKLLLNSVTTLQRFLDEKKVDAYKEADIIIAEAKVKAEKEAVAIKKQTEDLRYELERLTQALPNYFTQLSNAMRVQEELLNVMEERR
jgi:cell division initiation protein